MPPRKGKGKANESEGGPSTANTFKLDTRAVGATSDMQDPAERVSALDKKLESAVLGIGKINILGIGNDLVFGRYNDRALKMSEVNKMITSFEKHGMQWTKQENAIAIVIEATRLVEHQDLNGTWNSAETLPTIRFKDVKPIYLASGQHRVSALNKMLEKYKHDKKTLSKRIERLVDKDKLEADEVVEHEGLREKLGKVNGYLERMGQWGVIVYDIDILDGDKELGRHLSQNQVLHIYNETQEEQLVSILRDLRDAKEEGGKNAVTKCLDAQHLKATISKNTKLTKVLKHTRLMLVLMEDILPFGGHYRTRREFDVNWLSRSINVVMGLYAQYMSHSMTTWRYLGTKTETKLSLEKVKEDAAKVLQDDAEVSDEGREALKALSHNFVELMDEDCLIFVPVVKEIDDAASRCFKAYEGTLGARQTDYEEALERYRGDVISILEDHFASETHRSADDKRMHEDVKARTYAWLSDSLQDNLPMPLMTGYVMDRVWKELNAAKDGYTEVASWFECLLRTMKIYAAHTHAVDDHTEAIFSAIERERGMDVKHAADSVYATLMHWRVNALLHLHNKLSESPLQQMIGKRPSTKDEFVKAWNLMTQDTKTEAKMLYEQHKKYLGVGEIDMPISSLGTPCMHGLLVTGWDWRRTTLKKNLSREAEPLFQAMFLELRHVETYRPMLLRDPVVWGLRDTIQQTMTKHFTKTKLKASTAGSLAKPREWAYWDGITVEPPKEDVYVPNEIDADAQAQLVQDNRRIAAEQADFDAICKIKKTIMSMAIARVTPLKKSPLTVEVANAINLLTEALTLNASRQRLRALSGNDAKQFDLTNDIVDLNVPEEHGEEDPWTVETGGPSGRDKRQESHGDGSDGDDEGEELPPPRTSTKSPKGKGKAKAKEITPAASSPVQPKDTDVEMEENEDDVPPLPKPAKVKPRPKPVPIKKTSKGTVSKVANELFPRGSVNDGQDTTDGRDGQDTTDGRDGQDTTDGRDGQDHTNGTDGQAITGTQDIIQRTEGGVGGETEGRPVLAGASQPLPPLAEDTTGDPDVSLDLRAGLTGMTIDKDSSPLSSPPPVTQDVDIEMDPSPQLVKDFELAAELDAAEGMRRSARAKQPSNPRAAPVTSKGAARNSSASATSSSRGSSRGGHQSAPPAGSSSASKRTRRDTLLTSPNNKKKSRHHSGLSVSTHVADDVLTTPDM